MTPVESKRTSWAGHCTEEKKKTQREWKRRAKPGLRKTKVVEEKHWQKRQINQEDGRLEQGPEEGAKLRWGEGSRGGEMLYSDSKNYARKITSPETIISERGLLEQRVKLETLLLSLDSPDINPSNNYTQWVRQHIFWGGRVGVVCVCVHVRACVCVSAQSSLLFL